MVVDYKWEAGQTVFEPQRGWSVCPGRKLTIDRVTPSGRAVIGGYQYGADGRKVGNRYGSRIEPFTDQHEAKLTLWESRQKVGAVIEKIKWRELTQDECDAVLPVLLSLVRA